MEGLSADRAYVRPLARVDALVVTQLRGGCEALATDIADVRPREVQEVPRLPQRSVRELPPATDRMRTSGGILERNLRARATNQIDLQILQETS